MYQKNALKFFFILMNIIYNFLFLDSNQHKQTRHNFIINKRIAYFLPI